MSTNRKSYNGAYEVPTKGKPEQEMTNGSADIKHIKSDNNGYGGNSKGGGSRKPSKSEY